MTAQKTKQASLIVLLLGGIALVWWLRRPEPSASSHIHVETLSDMEPLTNRIWIDHIPKDERDQVEIFAMLDEPNMGAFSLSSAYEGNWTTFEWTMRKGLRFQMLQSQKQYKVGAKIMSGAKCAPFDYCLRLKGAPRSAKKYGSMEDWVIQDLEPSGLQNQVQALVFQAK